MNSIAKIVNTSDQLLIQKKMTENLKQTFDLIQLHQELKFALYKKLYPTKSDDELNATGIPYCVTGGFAVGMWSPPRGTSDIDIVIRGHSNNISLRIFLFFFAAIFVTALLFLPARRD